jgi:protein-tyrosine phosphatase
MGTHDAPGLASPCQYGLGHYAQYGLGHHARALTVVDLHTHVLPGLDDGPRDLRGSIAMAELAAHGGTRTLVATPHVRADYPDVTPDLIDRLAAEVDAALQEKGIGVGVVAGAEVDLEAAEEMTDAELRSVTLARNGRDLLVETPYERLPRDFEERLAAVQARGFRITLAHPERNASFQGDPERLRRLSEAGTLVQLTASSLDGRRTGPAPLAVRALRGQWATVMASDSHSARWRPPDLNVGVIRACQALPEAAGDLEWMVEEAPRAILEGRELPERPPPAPPAPPSRFRLGFRR